MPGSAHPPRKQEARHEKPTRLSDRQQNSWKMEALKGSSPHGDGSSWRWSEGQGRWTSLPSPQMMAHTEPIDERGSFLEPINSFKLDSEPASTMDSPLRADPIPPTRVPPAGYAMARQESAELTNTIQSAFDEMDAALASRPPQNLPVTRVSAPNPMGVHPTSLNAHAPSFTPLALREQRAGASPWREPEVYRRFDRVAAGSEASESSPAEGAPHGMTPQWGAPAPQTSFPRPQPRGGHPGTPSTQSTPRPTTQARRMPRRWRLSDRWLRWHRNWPPLQPPPLAPSTCPI